MVACSASDRQSSNFESCVWRAVSSDLSHHPQEVLMAQFGLNVYESGLTKVFSIIQQFSTVKWEQRQGSYKDSLRNPEKRATNADLMLAQRLRRWANIKAVLDECLVTAGRWLSHRRLHSSQKHVPRTMPTFSVILLQFSPTCSCVSLPRPTTSSGWKLLIFL